METILHCSQNVDKAEEALTDDSKANEQTGGNETKENQGNDVSCWMDTISGVRPTKDETLFKADKNIPALGSNFTPEVAAQLESVICIN